MNSINPLYSRNYLKLTAGSLSASISFWIQIPLILIIMYELTESPIQVTFANVIWALPWSMIGGLAGNVASKYNDRKIMILGRSMSFIAMLILTTLSFLGHLNIFVVYITLFIHGTGVVIDFPAKRQLMLDILGREFIVRGNAVEAFFWQFSKLIGPLLAGLFLSLLSESYALVLLCFFLSLNLASIISIDYIYEGLSENENSSKVKIRDYINLLKNNRAILVVCATTVLMNLFMFPQQSLSPFIAVEVLGRSSTFSSIILSSEAIGAIITSISLLLLNTKRIGRVFSICSSLCLFFLFIYSFSNYYILSLIMVGFVGLGIAGFGSTQSSILQLTSSPKERGLAMGLLAICIGTSPIGSFLYGIVAETYGAQMTLRFLPITGLVLLLILIFSTKIIHKINTDTTSEDLKEFN